MELGLSGDGRLELGLVCMRRALQMEMRRVQGVVQGVGRELVGVVQRK